MSKPLKKRRKVTVKDSQPDGLKVWERLFYGVLAAIIGGLLGILIDILLSFALSVLQPGSSGGFYWNFVWVLGVIGLLLGLWFGARSAEFFVGLFNSHDVQTESTDDIDQPSAFWIGVAIKVVLACIVLWTLAMWLA